MIAPAPVDGKPLSHPDLDPVWAAFSDHGVAPVFHVSEFESPLHPAWRQGEPEDGERLFDSIFLYLAPAVALANFQGSVPKARTLADIRRWMNPLATLYGLRYLEQGHARGKIIIRID